MMKKLLLIFSFFAMAQLAAADVSTRVCLADGNTPLKLADPNVPLVYRDIMAGTQLTIIVSSNVPEWENGGGLLIADANRDYGVLSARGTEPNYQDSCLPAAGTPATVHTHLEPGKVGYKTYVGVIDVSAGDWFIIDYNAAALGPCKVGFYDHDVNWFDPVRYLEFTHVQTRDFNNDGIVNFADFDLFAYYWQTADCTDPNLCEGADLDENPGVDGRDLALFVDYWLERTHSSWF